MRCIRASPDTFTCDPPGRAPYLYHRKLPGYEPSPLLSAERVAAAAGVGRVWVKDESHRLGLPSFKILGASWAVYRALERRAGGLSPWSTFDELRAQVARLGPLGLAAATDGNHGRAVARMARVLGLHARIFVPSGTAAARIAAITAEGADCEVVAGGYDAAVQRSAREAGARCLVISDTSWPGYEDVPAWVIEGYSTIFFEVDEQLASRGREGVDVVVVQAGVGALAAAAGRHYRSPGAKSPPVLVAVEPLDAACLLASVEAGDVVTLPGTQDSIMAGLNCGTPSAVAWPTVSKAYDLFCAISDDRARAGMRLLASDGIVSGETGAAGVGGLLEIMSSGVGAGLGVHDRSSVLVLSTEGATDPESYEAIVGSPHKRFASEAGQ
jgi:diaminopropionate ammonia-lyase